METKTNRAEEIPMKNKTIDYSYGYIDGQRSRQSEIGELNNSLKSCQDTADFWEKKADEAYKEIEDYKEVIEDKHRLTKEIDVIINGENAAEKPSLCDLIGQIKSLTEEVETLKNDSNEELLNFIDWFGSWQEDKNLSNYGINDILKNYLTTKKQ